MKKSKKIHPSLKPRTEAEWLEVMQAPAKMRDRIKACTDSNETVRICMMAADTAGLDELDRMTITAFHALVQLEDLHAKIAMSDKVKKSH